MSKPLWTVWMPQALLLIGLLWAVVRAAIQPSKGFTKLSYGAEICLLILSLGWQVVLYGATLVPCKGVLYALDVWAYTFCAAATAIGLGFAWHASLSWLPVRSVWVLGSVLSVHLAAAATHWLLVYLALASLSITMTLLVVSEASKDAWEAGLKYMTYSLLAVALTLAGVSWQYMACGSMALADSTALCAHMLPMICLLSALSLGMTAFPWHWMAADIAQGASYRALACLSSLPKLATVAVWGRLCMEVDWPETSYTLRITQAAAISTLLVGHGAAFVQRCSRRTLAYHGVAQSGLVLSAIALGSIAKKAIACYTVVHALSMWGVWTAWDALTQKPKPVWKRRAAQAVFLGCLLTLAGLPPTLGLPAKIYLLGLLMEHAHTTPTRCICAVALAGSTLSMYYLCRLGLRVWKIVR